MSVRGEGGAWPAVARLAAAVAGILGLLASFAVQNAHAGKAGCDGSAEQVAATERSMTSDGLTRTYRLQVPPGHDGTTPLPLVLNLHGYNQSAEYYERSSGLSPLADREGFVLVHPQGLGKPLSWNSGGLFGALVPKRDDVRFISSLIDQLIVTYCIEPSRVFATGFSNGGGMVDRLGCELAGKIAAIASVAGSFPERSTKCSGAGKVAVQGFHGDADNLAPYEGDIVGLSRGVSSWLADWATANGCRGEPSRQLVKADVIKVTYRKCPERAQVSHFRMLNGRHGWFTHTTSRIWRFFRNQPKDRSITFALETGASGRYEFQVSRISGPSKGKVLATFDRSFESAGVQTVRWRVPQKILGSKPRTFKLHYAGKGDQGDVFLKIGPEMLRASRAADRQPPDQIEGISTTSNSPATGLAANERAQLPSCDPSATPAYQFDGLPGHLAYSHWSRYGLTSRAGSGNQSPSREAEVSVTAAESGRYVNYSYTVELDDVLSETLPLWFADGDGPARVTATWSEDHGNGRCQQEIGEVVNPIEGEEPRVEVKKESGQVEFRIVKTGGCDLVAGGPLRVAVSSGGLPSSIVLPELCADWDRSDVSRSRWTLKVGSRDTNDFTVFNSSASGDRWAAFEPRMRSSGERRFSYDVTLAGKSLRRGEFNVRTRRRPRKRVYQGTDDFAEVCEEKHRKIHTRNGRRFCWRPSKSTYRVTRLS